MIQLALSTLLSLASCSGGSVKIATLRGPSALQMVQLIDSLSRCSDARISVTIYDEPMQLLEEMSSGDVDFATLPVSMEEMLRGKGYGLSAVTIWGGMYLCGSASQAAGIGSLRGQTVHTLARGMAPDILLRQILEKNGLAPDKDVIFDYSYPTHSELLKAAMAGRTSLFLLPEPLLSQALNARPDLHIVADLAEEWMKVEQTPLPVTALFCKEALAGKDVEAAVIEAIRQSSLWVDSHPDAAADLAVRYGISSDREAVKSSIPRSAFKVVAKKI